MGPIEHLRQLNTVIVIKKSLDGVVSSTNKYNINKFKFVIRPRAIRYI